MPTISTALKMMDQFSAPLARTITQADKAAMAMDRLRQAIERPATLRLNANGAEQQLRGIERIVRSVKLDVTFNARQAVQRAQMLKRLLQRQLDGIQARIRVELPASLNVMFANLQRLVMKLIAAIRRFRVESGNQADMQRKIAELQEKIAQLQSQINSQNRRAGQSSSGWLSNMKGIVSAYLSIAAARSLLGSTIGAAMDQQTVLDTLAARTGSAAHGQAIFDDVTKQALKYGQDVEAALAGSQSFMSATMDPKTITDLNMLAMRLSKLNPGEGLEGAVFSLKELLSGDYTSISERFNISRSMLKDSEARAAGMRGDVEGFIKGMDKLLNQQNMTQDAFEKMLDTPSAKWNRILETFKFKLANAGMDASKKLVPLFDKIFAIINSDSFDKFIKGLQRGLSIVVGILTSVVNGLMWVAQVVRDNWPIILGVLATIGTYFTIMAMRQVPALIAKLWAMIPPILAQAAAWLAANWPIALIAVAIGILIATLAYFGVSVEDVVGFVTGVFYGLYAFIYNKVALLWNTFASFAEFLVNLFIDPVYSVKKLFYDLGQTFGDYMINMVRSAEDFAGGFMEVILGAVNEVLKGVNWFVDKVNSVFGSSFDTVDLFNTDNPHALSDSLQNFFDGIPEPTSDKDVFKLDRMGYKNIYDNFQKGTKRGEDMVKNFMGAADKAEDMLGDKFNNGNNNLPQNIDKVKEVGKIKDKVDISSEDLKMMRELAEMKSIQNFVTYTPTVSVSTGPVSKDVDVNEIVARIEKTLEEDLASNAAGVYA